MAISSLMEFVVLMQFTLLLIVCCCLMQNAPRLEQFFSDEGRSLFSTITN